MLLCFISYFITSALLLQFPIKQRKSSNVLLSQLFPHVLDPPLAAHMGEPNPVSYTHLVRYDPDTDTICDPFTLVQLGESPSSVKLQDSGTGFYAVDLGNKNGSYVRQSLTKFTYQLVMSAELQAAVPNDPCVCAGDYIDLILSVRNTGNLPLSGLNVAVKKGSQVIQTLHIDCTQPQESTNLFFAANGNLAAEQKGVYTIRRVDGMYDALNGDSWNITSTNSNGVTTQRNVRTTLLMPCLLYTSYNLYPTRLYSVLFLCYSLIERTVSQPIKTISQ